MNNLSTPNPEPFSWAERLARGQIGRKFNHIFNLQFKKNISPFYNLFDLFCKPGYNVLTKIFITWNHMADEAPKKKERRPQAAKRHLQSLKRNAINRAYKSKIKTRIKALQDSLTKQDGQQAQETLKEVYSLMDKGVKKGIIKKNKASRTKSRLATKVTA